MLAAIVAPAFMIGVSSPAIAADEKKRNPQQERMKACNAQAGDKTGDERKAFMSKRLKGEDAMPMTQQEKMKNATQTPPRRRSRGTTARRS